MKRGEKRERAEMEKKCGGKKGKAVELKKKLREHKQSK